VSTKTWRLIPWMVAPGRLQMAIDLWLLEQHRLGLQPPMLRFYGWLPAAISLGYHQRHYPDAWRQLQWQGRSIDLVRRPTGGRAVLHQGDLTYAVVASGVSGNRRAVYQALCEFLLQGWQTLAVSLRFGSAGHGYRHQPDCFSTATVADLVMPNGYKLIGSAQLYRDGCVLQQGSMRLQPNADLYQAVFGDTPPLLELPPALAQLSRSAQQQQIMRHLCAAAQACWGIRLDPQSLTAAELKAAAALADIDTLDPG
jgi:lipoate-protein ligase A